jgi:single-strand DNA-binding protein
MGSINQATILGRVGRDPEVRATKDGTSVASFSVATSTSYKGEERTEWHNLVLWGRLADVARNYVRKGDQVCVIGQIQYRKFTDKEGNERQKTEINVRELTLLGSGPPQNGQRPPGEGKRQAAPSRAPAQQSMDPEFDDEIPF